MSERPYPGEINVRQKLPLPRVDTPCNKLPNLFAEYFSDLWVLNVPWKRWFMGKNGDCWGYKNQIGKSPRILLGHGRRTGEVVHTHLRRIIAEIFFAVEETEKDMKLDRIYVIMDCGNVDCVNPHHMTFADHPRLRRD